MADLRNLTPGSPSTEPPETWQLSVDEAREHAKQRFRDRLANGEQVGNCSCHEDDPEPETEGDGTSVVGVRFRDSGRVFFFASNGTDIPVGTWIVARTSRGEEAGRVVIAPRQMLLSQLDGDLKPIERILTDDDVTQIEQRRKDSSQVVRRGGELSRGENMGIKVIAAEYSLDGSRLTVSYSAEEHGYVSDLRDALEIEFDTDVEMRSVGAREEARLIGGLGKCGRTLCCSSWLPIYPDVSMGMAKNQDLSLNPGKVTGLCGRLLCCLSYENEQYKQAKQILPRLGQRTTTPDGEGMVVSLQILKELVTVRLDDSGSEVVYPASDLPGMDQRSRSTVSVPAASEVAQGNSTEDRPRRRRRRRRRNRSNPDSKEGREIQ